jgi:hypothetical protein
MPAEAIIRYTVNGLSRMDANDRILLLKMMKAAPKTKVKA